MFQKLQQKWKVSAGRLLLVITTFAIGGSLCGYLGRKLMGLTNIDRGFLWILLYILFVTLLWPLTIILVSIPLGQYAFFKKYLKKILGRMCGTTKIGDKMNDKNNINPL